MSGSSYVRTVWAVPLLVIGSISLPAHAAPDQAYDQTGTVISMTANPPYLYRLESSDKMYSMACTRIGFLKLKPCEWNGRSISVGDVVRFRIAGDSAYIPVDPEGEERFIVEMAELKELPPIPASQPGSEGAVVLGFGLVPEGDPASLGLPNTSTGSMTPVVAIPTTGGPPEVVIPTAPASGGVVTGVPATGGAPITAIPVAPTSSSASSNSAPTWIHILRLETANSIYDLGCVTRGCRIGGTVIQQGNLLSIRIQKKWAYLSVAGNPREQRFFILSVHPI